jgi:hypothetical protein
MASENKFIGFDPGAIYYKAALVEYKLVSEHAGILVRYIINEYFK